MCILFSFLRAVSDIVFWGVGKEGVAAASFLQTNLLCLVHGKVLSGGQVELWIKTGNSMLTELVTKHCSTTF